MWFKLFSIAFLISSCANKNDPDTIFKRFIGEGKGQSPSRQELINLSTGKMKSFLEKMTDDQFSSTLAKDFAQQAKIKIRNTSCDQVKCTFTYSASYEASSSGQKTYDIESKKVAFLLKIGEEWKVEDIDTVKSYYEGQEIK